MSDAPKSSIFYPILQDYADWSSQVIRAAFYPEKIPALTIVTPHLLRSKLEDMASAHQLSQAVIDEVVTLQQDLHAHTESMLKTGTRPELDSFDKFLSLYEAFSQRLDRFDVDSMLADFGVDRETGLRNSAVMISDLERELERRARRGHPFSVVMGQVDRPDLSKLPEQTKQIAKGLRVCMRSFDDAYLSGKNEFLVSLKQTDNAGALRFVDRLKDALARDNAKFTMSFCAAEPMPGDDLKLLVANVRSDLKEIAADGAGESVEYEELSPLQRFIKSMMNLDKK